MNASPKIIFDFEMPFDEAQKYFSFLGIISKEKFYKNLKLYAGQAFTISKISSIETLKSVKKYISTQLESGKVNPDQIKKIIQEFAVKNGDDPLHPFHLDTVVRTNLQTAFQKGRYIEQKNNPNEYLQYFATLDGRETPLCHSLDGKVFKKNDPFWETYYPPNHFNCRSTTISLSKNEVEAERLQIEKSGKEYLEKEQKANPKLSFKPGSGFSNSPEKGLSSWIGQKCKEHNIENVKEAVPVTKTETEIEALLKEKFQSNSKEFNENAVRIFKDAPEDIKKIILNTTGIKDVIWNANGGSYHFFGQIVLGKGSIISKLDQVLAHEFGHYIDYKNNINETRGSDFGLELMKTSRRLRSKKNKDIIAEISSFLKENYKDSDGKYNYDNGQLADFFGALTNNKVGWGHSTSYYKTRPTGRQKEAFAQLFSLKARGCEKELTFIEKYCPEILAIFNEVIKLSD